MAGLCVWLHESGLFALLFGEQVKCPSGKGSVMDVTSLCDGHKDCADGSDETVKFCSTFNCSQWLGQYTDSVCCAQQFLRTIFIHFQYAAFSLPEKECSAIHCLEKD